MKDIKLPVPKLKPEYKTTFSVRWDEQTQKKWDALLELKAKGSLKKTHSKVLFAYMVDYFYEELIGEKK
tara:strand:- start:487 stop:693 length:207 start_codon:yes stop_codon:yes gene_type:complete